MELKESDLFMTEGTIARSHDHQFIRVRAILLLEVDSLFFYKGIELRVHLESARVHAERNEIEEKREPHQR